MTASVNVTQPRAIAVRSAVDVCAFVDDLPGGATGELVFETRGAPPQMGAVFVEQGRVCWAAAPGLAGRLSDLLAASAHVDRAGMEEMFEACRRDQVPLGEYLVQAGVVSAASLRSTLLRHSAESLHVLCENDTCADWVPRSGGYNSRFTFATAELLPRTFAESHRPIAASLNEELAEAFGEGEWGVGFVRTTSRAAPDPVAVVGTPPERAEALLRLGRWAASALDVARPLHEEQAFVAAVLADGAYVAWQSGEAIIAGATRSTGPARLLRRRAHGKRRDVPHGSF